MKNIHSVQTVHHCGKQYGKLKREQPYDPVIALLGIKYKNTINTNSKRYMHPYVYCNIIYNKQSMEAAQVSTDRWMDKEDVVHTYNGLLFSHKRVKSCHL